MAKLTTMTAPKTTMPPAQAQCFWSQSPLPTKKAADWISHKPAFGDPDELRGHGEILVADILAISDPFPVFPVW